MTQLSIARHIVPVCRAFFFVLTLWLHAGPASAQSQADIIRRGEAKSAACGACHGGPGRTALAATPALAAQPEQFLVLQMVLIREGLRDVPQMAGMLNRHTDGDFADIAAYYARQALPKNEDHRDPARFARGAQLSKGMGCGSCHRADYSGQQQMPRLAGQREDYLAAAMKAYRDNRRSGSDTSMNAVLYQVPDADIEALAHYLSQM